MYIHICVYIICIYTYTCTPRLERVLTDAQLVRQLEAVGADPHLGVPGDDLYYTVLYCTIL